ncbi:MAG: hypothetical protein JO311_01665 [Candidatus Eremiobacteraeota bacterium]|nr:hypothetical protein [Candidatus Eremiobacteraeota bacterium]MBV9262865.1 hypothetical protein [Candidatus Eremiobacteraeota bacterium]
MAETLLVVGGGTMGAGIAAAAAIGGYDVEVIEPQAVARERAAQYLEREETRSGVEGLAARIRWSAEIRSGSEASVAIEAVPERFEMKRDVFAALDRALAADALIATNTSSLSVDELADTVSNPQRVIGLHFFNPPTRMRLVEVVRGAQSSAEAIERGLAIVHALGKTPVETADTPGFIVNRVARPFYLQSLRALTRGLATAEELDALARGAGFRMGPFELMDLIGLDVNLATTESLYERTGSPRFAPVALQEEMVARGELGRKTGAGFYRYPDGCHPERSRGTEVALASDSALSDEHVAVVGFGDLAAELGDAAAARYAHVQRIENDDMLPDLSPQTTILVDAGDGVADRGGVLERLDAAFGPETLLIADAYATDLSACARRLRHPERLLGFGILGSLRAQRIVEIVDLDSTSDETLELGQEFFAAVGKASILVEDAPALFLGRTVGSIVNEAMIAVHDGVASPEDINTAMQLGANYPFGPIAWGRAIRGARIDRILRRLADDEGSAFAPHRSLWLLDVEEEAGTAASAHES